MMENWEPVKLGDCLELLNGYAFKSKYFTDDNSGLVLIKGSNLGKGNVLWNESKYWKKEDELKYSKFVLKANDVILAMDRPWVNGGLKFAIIKENDPKSLLVQRIACLRANSKMDQFFLKFVVASEAFAQYVKSIQGGVGVPHISPKQIKSFEFSLPPLPTQRRIASILSAYDDLIENNLMRITLLEEKAQLTYEEWFVRMRFPGHEKVKIDKESGLPEGWEKTTIGNICNVTGGGTPSKKKTEYWENGDITWFSPTDLSKNNSLCILDSSQKITELGLNKSSAKLLTPDSFMMSSRATIGMFAIIDKPFSTNQGFINVTPIKKVDKEYLLYNFITRKEEFKNHGTGSTFPEITKGKFKALGIIWPENQLIEYFHKRVSIVHVQMSNLQKQISLLKEARDLLLPRLMTGIIDVDKLTLESEEDYLMVAEDEVGYGKLLK